VGTLSGDPSVWDPGVSGDQSSSEKKNERLRGRVGKREEVRTFGEGAPYRAFGLH
jgi:hypothetical protein